MAPVAPLFNPNRLMTVAPSKKSGLYAAGWVAIWKTPKGNFIHAPLPSELISRTEAETYARTHPAAEWTAR